MTPKELDEIEKIIDRKKPDNFLLWIVAILLVLFINGCFKGCGY